MPVLKNPQHERFAREYVKDFNGTQSALKAGYAKSSAHVQASRLIRIDNVKQRIEELNEPKGDVPGMSPEEILLELDAIGRSRVKDYIDLDTGELRGQLNELPDDVQAAIGTSFERKWDADANGGEGGWAYKVKLYDKLKALDMHARHRGMFVEQIKIVHNILDTVTQEEVDERMGVAEVELLEELGLELVQDESGEYVPE